LVAIAVAVSDACCAPGPANRPSSKRTASNTISTFPELVKWLGGAEPQVTAEGDGRELVELDSDTVYRFEVERVGKRWLVASFRVGEE